MPRINTVLLDVGGVLLLPSTEILRDLLLESGCDVGLERLRRAHYAATAAMDAQGGTRRDVYRRAFARACGVPAAEEERVVERMRERLTGHDWTRVVDGVREGLGRILAAGHRIGILSNSTGTVDDMLSAAEVCQLGPGPGVPVEVIVDSGCVGEDKPDPRIFRLALDAMGIEESEAVYVGDTARADVDGARNAGIAPIHLDPYGDCPDPRGDHRHVRDLGGIVALLGNAA